MAELMVSLSLAVSVRVMLDHLSQCMRFPTMWYVRPAKPQISLRICADWSEPFLVARIFYDCKLHTEHQLDFLSLNEAADANLSLHMLKCHIAGNLMHWLISFRRTTICKFNLNVSL